MKKQALCVLLASLCSMGFVMRILYLRSQPSATAAPTAVPTAALDTLLTAAPTSPFNTCPSRESLNGPQAYLVLPTVSDMPCYAKRYPTIPCNASDAACLYTHFEKVGFEEGRNLYCDPRCFCIERLTEKDWLCYARHYWDLTKVLGVCKL
jgi:hypothetical protein